jgi:hypothetical protein
MEEAKRPRKMRRLTCDKIDETKPAALIVAKFGGLSRFCSICGFGVSSVHGWMVRGLIPSRFTSEGHSYQAHILAKAHELGIELGPEDFIETTAVAA